MNENVSADKPGIKYHICLRVKPLKDSGVKFQV